MSMESIDVLNSALNASWLRNSVISNNIANADTPGFKRSVVKFEDYLSDAQDNLNIGFYTTNDKHINIPNSENIEPQVETVNDTSYRLDGNNVDIDNEMSQLAKNNLMYDALISRISGEFNSISGVITDGR